jgi:hypothetical protein
MAGEYEIEINGQRAVVMVAHFNAVQTLVRALLSIRGADSLEDARGAAESAIRMWDIERAREPVVLITVRGGPKT